MPKKPLLVANPYNKEELELIKAFESENDLGNSLTLHLQEISGCYSKEEYDQMIKGSNEVEQYLFLDEEGKIVECCLLTAYRDIKSCYLSLSPSKKISRSKKLLSLATEHAFNIGMLEIFATANMYDRALHEVLEIDGYENLGEENGVTSFVKSFEIKEG
jgi:hypothetical protein